MQSLDVGGLIAEFLGSLFRSKNSWLSSICLRLADSILSTTVHIFNNYRIYSGLGAG